MKIENGKYIYTSLVQYTQYDGDKIHPVAVEFTVTTNIPVYISDTMTISEWIDRLFKSKLVLPAKFNVDTDRVQAVKEFFDDFLFVERTDYEYISMMLYTILNSLTENKIESLTYKLTN